MIEIKIPDDNWDYPTIGQHEPTYGTIKDALDAYDEEKGARDFYSLYSEGGDNYE